MNQRSTGHAVNETHSKSVPVALLLSAIAFVFDGFGTGDVFLSGLLFFIGLLLVPVYVVLAFFKIGRNTAKGIVVMMSCAIGSMVYCNWLDSVAMERAEPIVQAIKQYQTNEGKYPNSIEELLPKYVDSFPDLKPTGKSPKLEYEIVNPGPILSFKNGAIFSHKAYEFWNGRWVTYD